MPFVRPDVRERLDKDPLGAQNPGELGYTVALLCDTYLYRHTTDANRPDFRFSDVAELMGTWESIKMELYRRVLVSYEDMQRDTAGDCWRQNIRAAEHAASLARAQEFAHRTPD